MESTQKSQESQGAEHSPHSDVRTRNFNPTQTTAKFGADHATDVIAFNSAVAALDEAIRNFEATAAWQSIVTLSLIAHFKELATAAFQELAFRRPAAAKVLVRASLETTYQIVASRKDPANFDKLTYKSISSRLSSIKKWRNSVASDALKAKAAQPIADLEKQLKADVAHKLDTILEVAKLADMEHDYRTDYAILSNFTHADLETILRDRVRTNEPENRLEISFDNLNYDVSDVTSLIVFQHVCILEALGELEHVHELGAYLDNLSQARSAVV